MRLDSSRHIVMLAITEQANTRLLWNTAVEVIEEKGGELTVLFFADERWEQAARLPISIEISTLTGESSGFTLERAQKLNADVAHSTERELQQLAGACDKGIHFEFYANALDWPAPKVQDVVRITVIAPKELKEQPYLCELQDSIVNIVLI